MVWALFLVTIHYCGTIHDFLSLDRPPLFFPSFFVPLLRTVASEQGKGMKRWQSRGLLSAFFVIDWAQTPT
jgi:hypothetical protein